jgi:transposase
MRARVLGLLDAGFSQLEVSRQTGVPRSTIGDWKRHPRSRRNHNRPGRPRHLDKHDVRRLIAIIRSGWEGRRLCWRKLGKEAGLSVSPRTIQRALAREGYTRCKACKKLFIDCTTKRQRKDYAHEHIHKPIEFWRAHMYGDECSFDTSKRGPAWVTRLPTERYHDHCMQHDFHSGRGSVMVWGAISYNWKSPLIFLEGTGKKGVRAQDYLEQVLEPVVAPAFAGLLGYQGAEAKSLEGGQHAQYVEDHAPIHGCRHKLVEVKRVLGIPAHPRPSSSPDLNPIENVWRAIKQRIKVRPRFPSTIEEMKVAVQEEWDRLQPADFNKYIDSMPERLRQLKERRGMQTQY